MRSLIFFTSIFLVAQAAQAIPITIEWGTRDTESAANISVGSFILDSASYEFTGTSSYECFASSDEGSSTCATWRGNVEYRDFKMTIDGQEYTSAHGSMNAQLAPKKQYFVADVGGHTMSLAALMPEFRVADFDSATDIHRELIAPSLDLGNWVSWDADYNYKSGAAWYRATVSEPSQISLLLIAGLAGWAVRRQVTRRSGN